MVSGTSKSIIEYFLVVRDESRGDRLVYYDTAGKRFETIAPRKTIDLALKAFDGKVKAVRRSSGGLILAEPYQLILLLTAGQSDPEVRIRVKFKDFRRDLLGNVNAEDYHVQNKIVSLCEVVQPFSFSLAGQQRFVLDFGRGLIPIYVFHYGPDAIGNPQAYFIEMHALKMALIGKGGTSLLVQPYRVARETLRYASDFMPNGSSEYKAAEANLLRLEEAGQPPIPAGFMAGYPIEIPLPHTHQGLRQYLREQMGFRDSENTSTTVKVALKEPNPPDSVAVVLPFESRGNQNIRPILPRQSATGMR